MLHWMGHLIESYGYAIVVLLVLAEGVGLPLPGETALFTAAISVVLGLVFGIVVAVHRPDGGLVEVLKSSGRTLSGSGGRGRGALVIAQVALAVVLLSAAGLMLNSVVKLARMRE